MLQPSASFGGGPGGTDRSPSDSGRAGGGTTYLLQRSRCWRWAWGDSVWTCGRSQEGQRLGHPRAPVTAEENVQQGFPALPRLNAPLPPWEHRPHPPPSSLSLGKLPTFPHLLSSPHLQRGDNSTYCAECSWGLKEITVLSLQPRAAPSACLQVPPDPPLTSPHLGFDLSLAALREGDVILISRQSRQSCPFPRQDLCLPLERALSTLLAARGSVCFPA